MSELKIRNVFLVVIYDKTLEESTTLNSFLNYQFEMSMLIIHNNGPRPILLNEGFYNKLNGVFDNQVKVINTPDNKPLSIIYNKVFTEYDAERYILLDDDTELSSSFVYSLKNTNADLNIPKIISSIDDKIYYPISNGVVVTESTTLDASHVLSIGSGLIINRTLIDKFSHYNLKLFDENYALYGVDYSFFRRLWWVVKQGGGINVCSSSFLKHSLSRIDKNESNNKFRSRERVLDVAITARQYPSLYSYYIFLRKVLGELSKMNFTNVIYMFRAYIIGRHPRCPKIKRIV